MSTNNATNTAKPPVTKTGRKATETKPQDSEVDPVLKLTVSRMLTELLASGDFNFEIPDEQIVAANDKRIAKLEARVAELEKKAGIPSPTVRADVAKLAKGGKETR